MSGTEETYHLTKEDIRKTESKASGAHGGDVPAGSDAAGLQVSDHVHLHILEVPKLTTSKSIVDKGEQNKKQIIEERKANLPLPDQPPGPSDFNSADQRTVNVGSGGEPTGGFSYGDDALREPATGDSAVRTDANALKTNTEVCRMWDVRVRKT